MLMFRELALRKSKSDKGLTLEMSASVGASISPYSSLESTLSQVDLFLERLSWEVLHAHSSKTQSKQTYVSGIC